MALVHDMAEAIVGDITPHCGVSQTDKYTLEKVCYLVKANDEKLIKIVCTIGKLCCTVHTFSTIFK